MTPVIAFGEALVDMLSSRLGDASGPETFTPYAGGAPANVAVACARLGVPSRFLGMVGADRFGRFLTAEMASHGVDVSGVVTTFDARTALAFVSRDAHGERTFDFYRPPAADLLYRLEHLPTGVFAEPAIVHLCSNSLTEEAIAETTLTLADIAQQIAQAHGPSGPNSAYLLNLAQALRELGTEDAHIFALEAQLQRYQ